MRLAWHCAALGIPVSECDAPSDFSTGGTIESDNCDPPLDVSFVLDELPALAGQFGMMLDLDRVATVGRSYGAWTATVIRGMSVRCSTSVTVSLRDERVR